MSNLIIVVNDVGIPFAAAKTSANNELLVKAAQVMMEESGCRNAYIMGQVGPGPEGPCQTTVYKVKAKLVLEGPLKGKTHKIVELGVDLETFKMI